MPGQKFGDDALAEPVGRVVFAEVVAVFGVDQLLVDALEHVLIEARQVVIGKSGENPFPRRSEDFFGLWIAQPVEEVVVHEIGEFFGLKETAIQDVFGDFAEAVAGLALRQRSPDEHSGDGGEIGMP